jgi:hypothetical protein
VPNALNTLVALHLASALKLALAEPCRLLSFDVPFNRVAQGLGLALWAPSTAHKP